MDIIELAEQNQQNAWKLLDETGIIPAWERIGATVHLVGSLKSGLLMKSRDIVPEQGNHVNNRKIDLIIPQINILINNTRLFKELARNIFNNFIFLLFT